MNQSATGNSQDSQLFFAHAKDVGGADVAGNFGLKYNGILSFSASNGINSFGYSTFWKATAALAINVLVKVDTANPDSFVICTTADTLCVAKFLNAFMHV